MGKHQPRRSAVIGSAILAPTGVAAPAPQHLPLDLRIQSDEIFLSGRFHRWQTTAWRGPDLDLLTVRMAVDATSPDQLTADPTETNLFSFTSTAVTKLDESVYSAAGRLRTSTGEHPFDLMVEIPHGHTAFFALGFAARREVLGDAWHELFDASGPGGIDAERRLDPRAGVRDPQLAAA
jgi:hypothetical protein